MNIKERYIIAHNLKVSLSAINWPDNAQEPDIVAKLVEELPDCIMKASNGVLGVGNISAGSAFIHQKPLAHFTKRIGYRDPELGDLLIVCRDNRINGSYYNAMLLQAKRTSTPFSQQIPNDHQYVLYSEWPEFEYKRAGYLNGKKRSVLPKMITQGAQYLLIDDLNPPLLFTASVDETLKSSSLFACTLAAIMSFDTGRTFDVKYPRDDWSQMILDLLNLSAISIFNRRKAGYAEAPRWRGENSFDFIINQDGLDDGNNAVLHNQDDNVEGEPGVSIICIDIKSGDVRRDF